MLRTGGSGVKIPAWQDISPLSGANAASYSIDMVDSLAAGQPGFEVTSAYAKNKWSYTSTSHRPLWRAQKNFIFTAMSSKRSSIFRLPYQILQF